VKELDPDEVSRVVLLGLLDGSAKSLEEAEQHAADRALNVFAVTSDPTDACWQAAVTTAIVVAVRAFGRVTLITNSPDEVLSRGPFQGRSLRDFMEEQGAAVALPGDAYTPSRINVSIGDQPGAVFGRVIHARWDGWIASVHEEAPEASSGGNVVVAAIGAASLAISEAFLFLLDRPGSTAGYRDLSINLWAGGGEAPEFLFAPAGWWLIGLGHLGQAYAWTLSHLPYRSPELVEVFLQDTEATSLANHSTSVLTPRKTKVPKTRLVADYLDRSGFQSRIVERRMSAETVPRDVELGHVALIGVDNLPSRRLESQMGWHRVIDAGLGNRPATFTSISLHSFPGGRESNAVEAWKDDVARPDSLPNSPGFEDLSEHFDECGVMVLAGKAVGVPFVGMTAAAMVVAAAISEVLGGGTVDVVNFELSTGTLRRGAATPASAVSLPALELTKN